MPGKIRKPRGDRLCPLGKQCLTRVEAEGRRTQLSNDGWRPYHCPRCGWWHVSSKPPIRRKPARSR